MLILDLTLATRFKRFGTGAAGDWESSGIVKKYVWNISQVNSFICKR